MNLLSIFNEETVKKALTSIYAGDLSIQPPKTLIEKGKHTIFASVEDVQSRKVSIQLNEDPSKAVMTCQCGDPYCYHMAAVLLLWYAQEEDSHLPRPPRSKEADRFDEEDEITDMVYQVSEESLKSFMISLLQRYDYIKEEFQEFIDDINQPMEYNPEYDFNDYWAMLEFRYGNVDYNQYNDFNLDALQAFLSQDYWNFMESLEDHEEYNLILHLSLSLLSTIEGDFLLSHSKQENFFIHQYTTRSIVSTMIAHLGSCGDPEELEKLFNAYFSFIHHTRMSDWTVLLLLQYLFVLFYEEDYLFEILAEADKLLKDSKGADLLLDMGLFLSYEVFIHLHDFDHILEFADQHPDSIISDIYRYLILYAKREDEQAEKIKETLDHRLIEEDSIYADLWDRTTMDAIDFREHLDTQGVLDKLIALEERWDQYARPFDYQAMANTLPAHLMDEYKKEAFDVFYDNISFLSGIRYVGDTDYLFNCLVKANQLPLFHNFFTTLKDQYGEELKDIYAKLVARDLIHVTGGRKQYKTYANYLCDLYQIKGGADTVQATVTQLCSTYPNRPAMIEEFTAILKDNAK